MVCSSPPPEVTMVHAVPPTLVIADAHRLFAAGLSKLLAGKFRIVSTVSDGRNDYVLT
jgi:hypothetical protein